MSIETDRPRVEQNNENNDISDDVDISFDSRIEPNNNMSENRPVDSLPSGDSRPSNQFEDFDRRLEPINDNTPQLHDTLMDFDDRVVDPDAIIMDTPFPGYEDPLRPNPDHDYIEEPRYPEIPQMLHREDLYADSIDGNATEGDVSMTGVTEYMHTRNESLENDRHPITGVKFVRKVVERTDGSKVEGVFPVFDSEFTAQLPDDLLTETDKKQFCECNKQLLDAIEKDPELKEKFTPEQIEQIKDGVEDGTAPDGYVWHHNEETGKMELVDADVHAKTGHTGGRAIWGGGTENR